VQTTGLQFLTDTELCRAWHHTSNALATIAEPSRRLAVVITREHLLNEILRRDRVAVEAWATCGEHARNGHVQYFDQH